MKKLKILGLLGMLTLLTGCPDGGGVGVCTGYSSYLNSTYCYSNYTKAECDERTAAGVNFVDTWYFHSGQTCSDRGLNEGSN